MSITSARRSLLWFVALFVPVSVALEIAIMRSGRDVGHAPLLVLALMWTPGIASLIVRLVRREGFGDVSFRWGGRRGFAATAVVCAYPIVVGAIAYGLAWGAGLATFRAPASTWGMHASTDATRFLLRLAMAILPGIPLSMISALGEEIGWRGFFLGRLIDARVPRPLLVSGVVWGVWHMPLILSGLYAAGPSPAFSCLMFLVSIIPAAYLFGWARLHSGSVWPAAIAHAAWNSIIQGVFDASTLGSSSVRATNVWIGESGVFVAAASAVVVALVLARAKLSLTRAATV